MPLQLDDLSALDDPTSSNHGQGQGQPLMLPIELIDEDPDQPRREFDADALQELADTIRERGVRQPISVRSHATQPGRWMLNFGARRLRASKLANKVTIPAFVDSSADSYDQVIENEQREGLRPLDFALFVERRLALNESQTEIARRLGKSQSYVARASVLIDAPDWIMALYRQGRCRGITELYLLRQLHAKAPDALLAWLAQQEEVTRSGLQQLKLTLSQPTLGPTPTSAKASTTTTTTSTAPRKPTQPPPAPSRASVRDSTPPSQLAIQAQSNLHKASHSPSSLRLLAYRGEQLVEIATDIAPAKSGSVFVREWPNADAATSEVWAADLTLVGFDSATASATRADHTGR